MATSRKVATPVVEVVAVRTAEQQAALDAMRANKEAPIVEPVAASAPEEAAPESDRIATAVAEAVMKLFGFGDDTGPSWKRKMAAFFAVVLLAGSAGHVIGTLAGYCIVGIAALGGSILWTYLITVLALMLSMYVGFKIGQYVGNYVLSGQIDADLAAAKNKVSGWFGAAKNKVMPA